MYMKQKNWFYILLAMIILSSGCRKNEINITEEQEIEDIENINFKFIISDENGEPISNAQVEMNSTIYYSDDNGVIISGPQKIPAFGAKVEISAEGYDALTKLVTGIENSFKQEKVILFTSQTTVISTGSTGPINGEGSLTLPNDLVREDGTIYNGEVTVKSKYLNPENPDFLKSAPGDLLAINGSEEYFQLASYGMYKIELFDSNNEKLQIPDEQTAIIEFPIAEQHLGNLDSTIPLWYFDENTGLWVEEGEAVVQDSKMIAEVGHFSWWNCDLPYEFEVVCLTFLDADGLPIPEMEIRFYVNNANYGSAYTDNNGLIYAKIPVGEIVYLQYLIDGVEIGNQNIGPFGENDDKQIIFTELVLSKISGQALDCAASPISNGYGYYIGNNGINFISLSDDGSFIYLAPGVDHELVLIDLEADMVKNITVQAADQVVNLDFGVVEVCGQELQTKISGHVLLDTDQDNMGDLPVSEGTIQVFNTVEETTDFIELDGGYYEFEAIPGHIYKMSFNASSENQVLVAAGDNSPDNDNVNDSFDWGVRFIHAMALVDEHDSDNDFWLIPSGTGIVSGIAMGDTDGDGTADIPLEWASLNINERPGLGSQVLLINDDGTFSASTQAAYFILFLDFDLLLFPPFIRDWDTSPDPDGDDSSIGSDKFIEVLVQDGESDADNEFIIDHSGSSSILCMILEDLDGDGVGDIPREGIGVMESKRNVGGTTASGDTDEFGIIRFYHPFHTISEYTISITSTGFEIIDIYDLSPDNDPLIIDGDLSKMEINVEEGEWDAGNVIVIRRL